MGWWEIDPETGKPLEKKPPEGNPEQPILLNALPEVENPESYYLGDCPWNMIYSYVGKLEHLLNRPEPFSEDAARKLLLEGVFPAVTTDLELETRQKAIGLIKQMWDDVDWCYDEDWERPMQPAEKKWIGENAVRLLIKAEE